MIYMHDICKTYEIGGEAIRALDHANLEVADGEFLAVVGPSGSGKSTLMNIMGCLDTADSGEYLLNNIPIGRYGQNQLAHIRNKLIGFIFQSFNLLSRLTALENVELPLIYGRVPATQRRDLARHALEMVDLADRMEHKPTQLSGGQQQRVAIARALAGNPALLLADEPTGNLDSKTGHSIMQIFEELHRAGKTIVLITHDDKVADAARRRVYISDGKVSEVHS